MKIAFFIPPQNHSNRGIGRYFQNLFAHLKKIKDFELVEFSDFKKLRNIDLIHFPFFDFFHFRLPLIKKYPTIVTIHDVVPLLFPKHYPRGILGSFALSYQKIALKNIDAVITDSNCSKKDIMQVLKIPEKKIFSVSLAHSPEFRKINDKQALTEISKKYNLPDTFILYVGDVNWNKNLINIAKASKLSGIDLVMVGKGFSQRENLDHPEMRSFKELIRKYSGDPAFHFLEFVPEKDLVVIINLAKALILASYYEGFGLPILESQACGTPVISSNLSSMPEVAGKGALFVDPYSVESIKEGILRILADKSLRDQLIKEGFANAEKFSWDKTAEETAEVYKYVLNK